MQDDDALDAKLYESGDIAQLLARYHQTILAVCIARMRGHSDAEDVAQNVRMRLYREFERGRRYSVPYRVVVFKVTEWTVKELPGRPKGDFAAMIGQKGTEYVKGVFEAKSLSPLIQSTGSV